MYLFLRNAGRQDREALGRLRLRASLASGEHVAELLALPEIAQFSAEHLSFAVLAESEGTLAGFVTVLPRSEPESEIEDLFVAPEYWRMGVGRRLIVEAERLAESQGSRSLRVIAGNRARPFYEAMGFVFAGTAQTRFEAVALLCKFLPGA